MDSTLPVDTRVDDLAREVQDLARQIEALKLLNLEMARRAIKLALPAVAVIALAYGLLGQYLPGEFGHPGIPPGSFLGTLVIAEGGLWVSSPGCRSMSWRFS